MYPLIFHKNLTEEKWFAYPQSQQALMIANEINRAKNFIVSQKIDQANGCYERALELTDLTSADPRWRGNSLKELRRFREMLAQQYASKNKNETINQQLYRGLLQLSPEAYRLLFPVEDGVGIQT